MMALRPDCCCNELFINFSQQIIFMDHYSLHHKAKKTAISAEANLCQPYVQMWSTWSCASCTMSSRLSKDFYSAVFFVIFGDMAYHAMSSSQN